MIKFTSKRLWLAVLFSVLMISSASAQTTAGTLNPVPQAMKIEDRHMNETMRREIAFVDSGVSDPEFFVSHLSSRMPVHLIKVSENGLERIATVLSGALPVDAVHIFSHGAPGSLHLGDAPVTHRTIGRHKETLQQIGQYLNPGADILLYGCQVGKGNAGRQFIEALGRLTAADIAASDDLTGAARLNGDWVLEATVGHPGPETYGHHDMLITYPSVLAFPNTISWTVDPFGGGTQTSNYTVGTADLGNIVFKATDDGLGTGFSSLTWMTGGGIAHASLWVGSYVGISIYEDVANYTNGIWFVFGTQNGDDFDFTSFNLGQTTANFNTMNVIGFRDGTQVAAQTVLSMPENQSATSTVNLSSDFDSVDEIRIRQETVGYYDSGWPSSAGIILDNIVLNAPAAANTDPTLTVGNGAYTENDGFTAIDASAGANDADGDAEWDTGAGLTVQITAGNEAADEIRIDTSGVFSISAPNLSHSGTQIGTISETSGTANDGTVTNNAILTLNFNSNATNAIVQALVRAIAYRSTSDAPTAGTSTRTVTFTLTDKNSAGVNDTAAITITALNDAPTVAANTGLTVNEGATSAISGSELNEGDPDDSGAGLTYTVTSPTANGTLWVDADGSGAVNGAETPIGLNGTFTQADIDSGYLKYAHNGGETTSDGFTFSLADGGENGAAALTGQIFALTVTLVNDPPAMAANTGSALNEGATDTITNTELNEGDPDDSGAGLTYTVTSPTANGTLWVDADGSGAVNGAESAIGLNGTFTQADIDSGYLKYAHNGGETTADSFTFSLADGGENGAAALTGQIFALTVTLVNDPPAMAANTGSALNEGATDTITNTELNEGDPDDSGAGLTYTVTSPTANGTLWVDADGSGAVNGAETPIGLNGTFTQADIDSGYLKYAHNGGETTSDGFTFSLADGGENGAAALTGQIFALTVTLVNDPPAMAANTGSALNEGATDTITNTELNEGDPDDSGAGLTYTVTAATANGTLWVDADGNGTVNGAETPIGLNGTFTQADIDSGYLKYAHNGGETTADSFTFSLADGGENGAAALTGQSFALTVTLVNDPPAVAANTGATLNEGAVDTITNTELNEGDPDDSGAGLTYTVTVPTANGTLWVDADGNGAVNGAETPIGLNGTFTQADIDSGYLKYAHNGGETTADGFTFSLADGGENGAAALTGQIFALTVTLVNDPPAMAANTGSALNEGATDTITNTELNEGDPDDSGAGLTYTVTAATANGTLWVDADGSGAVNGAETPIGLNGTFTQADIDSGYLKYAHNGGETTADGFTFSLADGGENGATALTGQTFALTIGPSNDAPVITGQSSLTTIELQAITITLSDLTVTDPDNTYPADFSLSVQNGANYTRQGAAITPNSGFTGNLSVPVVVNDGTADSNTYNLNVYVATVTSVTNTNDSGAGSLRQIIADATGGDTIDLTQVSGTITLIGSGLVIGKDLTLMGPADNRLVISGSNTMRVLSITSGAVTISDLTLADGSVNGDGGAISNAGSLTLTRVTLNNNTTTGSGNGGGIYNSGTLTARNCTFSSNTAAGNGGAVYNTTAATLNNCTLADNSAAVTGGLHNTGTLNMSNTLIADQINGDCANTGTIATNTNNLIEDNSCSPALSGDPDLGPLQDNGGSTHTHALQPGSPAIDAADGSTSESTDQRRIARPYDGDADNSSLPDIGSFEYQPGSVQFTSATYGATETAASVTITVSRTGGSDGAVSVNYATSAGTASNGTDYTETSGTLAWSDGDTANKNFAVVIADDAIIESIETLTVALSSFSSALEGSQTSATVSITDNDTMTDDNDGMPEAWEIEHGLDPAVDDANEDPDNDGLSNLEEYLKDSDPQAATPGPGIAVLRSPENLDTDQPLLPTLESGYSDSAYASDHAQTRWQVATDAEFVYPVLDITSSVYQTHLPVPNAILEENTVYFWRARYIDADAASWRWSSTWSFTTGADPQSDDNNDGIADKDEPPAAFIDIDGDGNDDHDQLDIKVIALPDEQGNMGIKAGSNVAGIDWLCHMTMDVTDQEEIPDTLVPPDDGTIGLYNFRLQLSEAGAAATATVHYSVPLAADAAWYKYDRINGWSDYSAHVVISADRKTVTLNFVDGGIGDADGVANGIIADPSGPVVVQPAGGTGPGPGSGGGICFISSAGVPRVITFGWIMTAVLALIGFRAVCKRHR